MRQHAMRRTDTAAPVRAPLPPAPCRRDVPAPSPDAPHFDFSRVPVHGLQRKLAVGTTDDPAEHEADRAADRVMGMAEPGMQASPPSEPPLVRMTAASGARSGESDAPPAVDRVLNEPGRPLDDASRAFFEPRFGRSFADVRVHDGAQAGKAAAAVEARAFTFGRDVVFAQGARDRRLLAHELAHVVQQNPRTLRRDPATAAKPAKKKQPPPTAGNILYIGMNSYKVEVPALKDRYSGTKVKVTTVTTTKEEAATKTPGGTFDLTADAGIKDFAASLGLDATRAQKVEDLVKGITDKSYRDELVHVISVYAQTDADSADRMTRVILSGHSYGMHIYDEHVEGAIYFQSLVKLAEIFPIAAGQTRHLLVDACLAGSEDSVKNVYTKAFPNLQTFWAHTTLTKGSSVPRLHKWAAMTDKNPTKLEAPPTGESNWALGAYQSDTRIDGPALMTALRADEAKFDEYFAGTKFDKDSHTGFLADYYSRARSASMQTSTVTGADHTYAEEHANMSYRLRFWPGMTSNFWKAHQAAIKAGYGTADVPGYGKISREDALTAIKAFDATTTATGAVKDEAARLLKALGDLDKNVLKDGWLDPVR